MDWSETPKKFDKVVVSVEVSIPRPGKEPLLGSWSLVETHGKFRDEVNKDVSPANIRVTYYYFQSLKRLTGLQAASRYTNLRTECSLYQRLEEVTDSIKLARSLTKDIMLQSDRELLQNIFEDAKQLSGEVTLLVQDWLRNLSCDNWVRFTHFLVSQFDLIDDFIKSPDNDIALIEKTYKDKRFLIELLENESIEYVNSKERWLSIVADYTEMYALMFYDRLLQRNFDVILFYREFIKKRKWRNVHFCAVDLDIIDHSVFETPPAEQIKIQKFIKGRCEISDLMASERSGNGNVAIHDGVWQKIVPKARALLKSVCPGYYTKRSCRNDIIPWACVTCKVPLFYAFEWGIFCDQCGAGLVEDFSFRCDNIEHIYPIPLTKEQCRELNALTPMKEVNILLLGSHRLDKLPWINGMCKYMSLKLLKSFEMNEFKRLIPSKCLISDGTRQQLKTLCVRERVNKNSSLAKKGYRNYHVVLDDVLFNIIDTPGLFHPGEDIRVIVESILDCVRHIDVLHGVSLFIDDRITNILWDVTWFWLKEILSNLHQNAVRNLTFCYTNIQLFQENERRLSGLRKLFKEIEVDFDLESKIFKFWNDCWFDELRYFKDDDCSNDVMYDQKRESSLEATRLLQTVSNFDPLFLNHARPNNSAN